MPLPTPPSVRVVLYVDGFNLYHGLRDTGLQRYYWLDIRALGQNLLKTNQTLSLAKYFTAHISGPRPGDTSQRARELDAKRKRQSDYLEALKTLPDFQMFYGHYLVKSVQCRQCRATWEKSEEKMTDVNIAVELILDAHDDRFDTALVVSGDSDQVPPVRAIRARFPHKRIVVAFPPGRHSVDLGRAAHGYFTIGRDVLSKSQFPDRVVKPGGYVLQRPARPR